MRHGRYERRTPAAKHGRHVKKRKLNKLFLVTLSVLLVLGLSVGGTVAYLIVNSGQVTNAFTPGNVACSVDSKGNITNTGNVDAYIRAAVMVNWVDDSGNVYAIAPTCEITENKTAGWYKQGEYYYYTGNGKPAVSPDAVISAPVSVTVTSDNPDEGTYHYEIDIVAEAIQAEGMIDDTDITAIENAWYGVTSRN